MVYFVFFLSGASALIYQVAWVKLLGRTFGNTVYSSALVIAVFMCGLGIGSYLVGRLADRLHQKSPALPLKLYAYSELLIGLLALGLALLLPLMEPLAAAISTYSAGPNGWWELSAGSYVLRYLIAFCALTPVTIVMGGTLTLLIRHVLATGTGEAGWKIGLLYGFNTLGAASGAFLTDFSLIPTMGLFAAQSVAVVCNLVAGVLAMRLVAGAGAGPTTAPERVVSPDLAHCGSTDGSGLRSLQVSAAIFVSGFAGMGAEILWFRYLSVLLGGYCAVFSLLLTVILVGMWLGALLGGLVHRHFGRAPQVYMAAQALFALSLVLCLASSDAAVVQAHFLGLLPAYQDASGVGRDLVMTWANLYPIVAITALPAVLMGFAYPLANAIVQRGQGSVGTRAGALYLANTLGAVLGSIAVGFFFIPFVGMDLTVLVLVGCNLAAILCLVFLRDGDREPPLRWQSAWSAATLAVVLIAALVWWLQPGEHLAGQAVPIKSKGRQVLTMDEDAYQVLAVLEDRQGSRSLFTNGHSMSGNSRWGQRYMRAFSHIPLLHMESPRQALVICFGVGTTLHAASLHPSLQNLEVVDISQSVMQHAGYFAATNHHVLQNDNVSVFVNDGRLHLWMKPEGSYDLITLEPPPIAFSGVSSLYTREFYQLARSRLTRGGFMTQWLPGYQVSGDAVLSMVRAFLDVFPNAILLSGAGAELILLGRKDEAVILDPDLVRRKLQLHPALAEDLDKVHLSSLIDLLGTYAASSETLAGATADVAPVTDDYPIQEYAVASRLHESHMPPELFDNRSLSGWCPACFAPGVPRPELGQLPAYQRIQMAYFHSPAFLDFRNWGKDGSGGVALPTDAKTLACIRDSAFLSAFFSRANTRLDNGQ